MLLAICREKDWKFDEDRDCLQSDCVWALRSAGTGSAGSPRPSTTAAAACASSTATNACAASARSWLQLGACHGSLRKQFRRRRGRLPQSDFASSGGKLDQPCRLSDVFALQRDAEYSAGGRDIQSVPSPGNTLCHPNPSINYEGSFDDVYIPLSRYEALTGRLFLENVAAALAPGTFYIAANCSALYKHCGARRGKTLFYWPKDSTASSAPVLPRMYSLVEVRGARHIVLSNFSYRDTSYWSGGAWHKYSKSASCLGL